MLYFCSWILEEKTAYNKSIVLDNKNNNNKDDEDDDVKKKQNQKSVSME